MLEEAEKKGVKLAKEVDTLNSKLQDSEVGKMTSTSAFLSKEVSSEKET